MTSTAESFHRRGVAAANHGRFSEARRLLEAASKRADDVDVRARITGTLAYVRSRTGDPSGAERICREALAIPGISTETRAILLGQLGTLAEHAGDLDAAERLLSEAISTVGTESVTSARMLVTRSLVNMGRRRLDLAAEDARAAISVYAQHNMPVEEAQIRHNLGYIALLRGELVSAMREMMAARGALMNVSEVTTAICDVDRAQVLRDAGLSTEAERLLAQAAEVFGRRHMPQASAEARFQLARSLLAHSADTAAMMAARSRRTFGRLGNQTAEARAEAIRLRARLDDGRTRGSAAGGALHRRRPTADDVEPVAGRLIARGFRMEAAALRLTFELAELRHGADRVPQTRLPRSAPLDLQLLDRELRAARATARGRHAAARQSLAAGLDMLSTWQESGSIDLQSAIQMYGGPLVYAGLDSAVRSGRADVIFEWSERARHLSQQIVPLRPPPDPAIARDVAELRALRAEADSDDWLSDPRTAAVRERVRERQWSSTGAASVEQPVGLAELQAELPSGTAHIAFVFTGTDLSSVVVQRDAAEVVRMAPISAVRRTLAGIRADLDMAATIRSGPMADVVRRTLDERLSALSDLLVAGPLRVARAERIVLTVPGVLREVPWAMLPGLRERPFTVAVSATQWVRFARSPRARPMSAGFVAGPRVARGAEELARAAAPWPNANVEQGDAATARRLTDLASDVDVLHIAAHGRHSADNPMFSGLELADGTLFGYDIDLIERVPDTVVLSACEVGRSSVRWGEEAVGMTRVWLHAGARAVVAAPVVVADDDACELLSAMHEGLAAGQAPSVALAEASRRTGIVAPFQVHGAGF